MPAAGFELGIPASDRPQTLAVDSSATGIGKCFYESKVSEFDYAKLGEVLVLETWPWFIM